MNFEIALNIVINCNGGFAHRMHIGLNNAAMVFVVLIGVKHFAAFKGNLQNNIIRALLSAVAK